MEQLLSKPVLLVSFGVLLYGCGADSDPPVGPGDPPEPGSLRVHVSTSGGTRDPDGYALQLDGREVGSIGPQGTVEIDSLSPGEHLIALSGIASNCQILHQHPRTVVISPAKQTAANLQVSCDSLLRNVIVFSRLSEGEFSIYRISPEGSDPVRMSAGNSFTISPDGSRIAYDVHPDIYTVKVDGSAILRLTHGDMPSWSPTGEWIAFRSYREENWDIYIMRPNGSDLRRLTYDPAEDTRAVWSPDGNRLAFTRDLGGSGSSEVFIINLDGSGEYNVTRHPEGDTIEDWNSRDQLLINSTRGGANQIWRIDLDGSNAVNLTPLEASHAAAVWSPDDEAIVFSSYRENQLWALYRADADGGNVVQLTSPGTHESDFNVFWVP